MKKINRKIIVEILKKMNWALHNHEAEYIKLKG